jgi:CrcB protein
MGMHAPKSGLTVQPNRAVRPAIMTFAMTMSLQPPSLLMGAAAVGTGAALGALLRWQLSTWLNPLHDGVPPGTLAANLIGSYLVGVAIAWFAQQPDLSPAWRLFVITGFLGGLTTFSTFSAEVVGLLQQGRIGMALTTSGLHLAGSLLATWAGWATVAAVTRSPSA